MQSYGRDSTPTVLIDVWTKRFAYETNEKSKTFSQIFKVVRRKLSKVGIESATASASMAFGETLRGFRQCGASNAELEQEVATLYIEHAGRLFALCRNADAQPGHGQGRSAGGISPVLCGTPAW